MMGTLAGFLAEKKIAVTEDRYWVEAEGDIEEVDRVLKITRIRVTYHIHLERGQVEDAEDALDGYLKFCPAAQSVIGCIEILDDAVIKEHAP